MYPTVHRNFVFCCLLVPLAPVVIAKPISFGVPITLDQPHQNSTLGDSLPWGPADFQVNIGIELLPMRRDAAFMTAVGLLAQETREDFNGRLSQPRIIFRDPNINPRLAIVVAAPGSDQRVLRRHVFWGIARILNHMVTHDAFFGRSWHLTWRGQDVGTIVFVGEGTNELGIGHINNTLTPPTSQSLALQQTSNRTGISDTNSVTFEYKLWGNLLTMENIFMSTVGALIQLAAHPDHNFGHFVGTFPHYRCFQVWYSQQRPPLLSKRLLISSIVASVTYALDQHDWHELKVEVKNNGLIIARGGYADHPLLPGALTVS